MMNCQIHDCTARAEHRLMGVTLCMVHFLRVKVSAALAPLRRRAEAA
jgi:hypothetical protein